jgi:uncharacterized protein YijF (DUF1287 family)
MQYGSVNKQHPDPCNGNIHMILFKSLCTSIILFASCGSIPIAPEESMTIDPYFQKLSDAALEQTTHKVVYDGQYYQLKYPNGDVPDSIGVCTDVIIRAYRKVGSDLQQLVHDDMKQAFAVYNKRRKSDRIDANIDHRRTPNLETFFTRQGATLPISLKGNDYLPGDIVFWEVAQGHVGIVVNEKISGTNRYYVVHNICCGVKKEDFLFGATIIGHYRWKPKS